MNAARAVNADIGPAPELAWVDVGLIDVDGNYQRPLKPRLVEKILAGFEWRKFGAIVLSRQSGGRFTVVEGQHRWKAASLHPAVFKVPAVIVDHAGTDGEAQAFIAINRDRMAVTSIEQYWAGLTAGDGRAQAIAAVLKAAGCDVVPENGYYRPHLTNAVAALGRCLERYGEGATRRALVAVRTAWPTEAKALRGTLITALARIIRENDRTISDTELARVISGQSFASMTAAAEGFRKLSGGSAETALSRTITELYNRGKRANQIYFGAQP